MSTQRAARLGDQIREELSTLFRTELKDPRIGFISIVKVEVAGDLRHAKVFVSVLGDEKQKKESLKGLQSANGFLRSELGKTLQVRYTPELHFVLDESIEHGTRIAQLLVQVQKEQGQGE
ncbi:MAG TPA: 30S ribosome-binding factor RbfA [Symbiobacteriaceae bacterium]|nr:30S ribosome-binding factor RbfA [Symbiobacteriaceae bacterium]